MCFKNGGKQEEIKRKEKTRKQMVLEKRIGEEEGKKAVQHGFGKKWWGKETRAGKRCAWKRAEDLGVLVQKVSKG